MNKFLILEIYTSSHKQKNPTNVGLDISAKPTAAPLLSQPVLELHLLVVQNYLANIND